MVATKAGDRMRSGSSGVKPVTALLVVLMLLVNLLLPTPGAAVTGLISTEEHGDTSQSDTGS